MGSSTGGNGELHIYDCFMLVVLKFCHVVVLFMEQFDILISADYSKLWWCGVVHKKVVASTGRLYLYVTMNAGSVCSQHGPVLLNFFVNNWFLRSHFFGSFHK